MVLISKTVEIPSELFSDSCQREVGWNSCKSLIPMSRAQVLSPVTSSCTEILEIRLEIFNFRGRDLNEFLEQEPRVYAKIQWILALVPDIPTKKMYSNSYTSKHNALVFIIIICHLIDFLFHFMECGNDGFAYRQTDSCTQEKSQLARFVGPPNVYD